MHSTKRVRISYSKICFSQILAVFSFFVCFCSCLLLSRKDHEYYYIILCCPCRACCERPVFMTLGFEKEYALHVKKILGKDKKLTNIERKVSEMVSQGNNGFKNENEL